MALLFTGGSTNEVSCGSAAVLDDLTALTVAAWIKPTDNANNFRFWGGKGTNLQFYRRGVDGTRLAAAMVGTGADAVVDIATGNMTTGWNFVAFTLSIGVSAVAYWGDLTTPLADKSFNAAPGT